jgi:aldehyde:ferredoxin oxidoreductase
MRYGHCGGIVRVDLTEGKLEPEEPSGAFYREDAGGSAMGAYFLLAHTPPAPDPFGPRKTLSLMLSVVTGEPVSGESRVTATAKSPLTDLLGDAEARGFWPAELKTAGFDGIVMHGKTQARVYLRVDDGEADTVPSKLLTPLEGGVNGGMAITREELAPCLLSNEPSL